MAAKPKPYPKSLGACADLLFKKREARLAADKVATALKAEETALVEHIIATMDKSSSGAMGKTHKVKIITKQKPQVKDWPAFYAYVAKTKSYDMLQRRLGEEAVLARFEFKEIPDPNNEGNEDATIRIVKKAVPGVELFNAVTVSLTKV